MNTDYGGLPAVEDRALVETQEIEVPARPRRRRNARAAWGAGLLLVAGALVVLVVTQVIPATDHMTHGFIAYHVAAQLLVDGKLGPQAYNDDWFGAQVRATYDPAVSDILSPSLPTMGLVALPFVHLPPLPARNFWIKLNVLLLMAVVGMLALVVACLWPGRVAGPWWAAFFALACLLPATAANFRTGQFFISFTLLFVIALYGLVTERPWLAGLPLGLALVFKALGVPFLLLLVVQKRWKALGWAVGTALLLGLATLPRVGAETWRAYAAGVLAFTDRPEIAVTAYQTTLGFWTHLLRFDPVWNPLPVAHWPQAVPFLAGIIAAAALIVTLWLGRSAPAAWLFAALTPLNIVLLPTAEEHHFVALLIPITLLGASFVLDGAPVPDRILGLAALLLLFVPVAIKNPTLGQGWLALLAYPRLYGAWLIWLLALRRMQRAPALQVEPGLPLSSSASPPTGSLSR